MIFQDNRIGIHSIILLILTASSCSVDPINNPMPIVFGEVVGTYTGVIVNCSTINSGLDSLCANAIPEKMVITISDQQNIYIRSESNQVPRLKMNLASDQNINGFRQFVFMASEEGALHSLEYNGKSGKILFYRKFQNVNEAGSMIFEGMK